MSPSTMMRLSITSPYYGLTRHAILSESTLSVLMLHRYYFQLRNLFRNIFLSRTDIKDKL